jgi:hypothetical protein
MTVTPKAAIALAAPIFLALIALFLGNKETPVQIGDECYVLKPLKLAGFFVAVDVVLLICMWLAGGIRF